MSNRQQADRDAPAIGVLLGQQRSALTRGGHTWRSHVRGCVQEVPSGWLPGASTTEIDEASTCQRAITLGQDYRGLVNTTATGLPCQRWDVLVPKNHTRIPARFPGYGLGTPQESHNFCRNPDGSPGGVWCYVDDPDSARWLLCGVPLCKEPLPWAAEEFEAAGGDPDLLALEQGTEVSSAGASKVRSCFLPLSLLPAPAASRACCVPLCR